MWSPPYGNFPLKFRPITREYTHSFVHRFPSKVSSTSVLHLSTSVTFEPTILTSSNPFFGNTNLHLDVCSIRFIVSPLRPIKTEISSLGTGWIWKYFPSSCFSKLQPRSSSSSLTLIREFLGPSPSAFSGKKFQNHRWWRHSWDLENQNNMCR